MTTTITVCRTCRQNRDDPNPVRDGYRLLQAVDQAVRTDGTGDIVVKAMACMSACDNACAAQIAAAGKVAYMFADLDPDASAEDLIAFARTYAEKEDGVVLKPYRPEAIRTKVHSRFVPLGTEHRLIEDVGEFTPETD